MVDGYGHHFNRSVKMVENPRRLTIAPRFGYNFRVGSTTLGLDRPYGTGRFLFIYGQNPKYLKYYTVTAKFKAHDENNEYKTGDKVIMQETRPLSREKRWVIISKSLTNN